MHDSMIEVIGRIHDFVIEAEAADDAIAKMATMLDADKAVLVRLAGDRRRDIALASHGMSRELIGGILSERGNPDTFLAHDARWKAGSIATDGDCKRSARRRKRNPFYREVLVPNGIEHTLLGIIDTSDVHHVLLWFHRPSQIGPFSPADEGLLKSLMPHWQRAIRQKLLHDRQDSAICVSRMIMDQSPFGFYIIGRDGDVLYMNSAAERQSKANAGLRVRNKSLAFKDRSVRAEYEKMLATAWRGGSTRKLRTQPIMFAKTDGNGSYQLGMRRLRLPARRGSLANRNLVALFVLDTGDRVRLSIDGLRSLYSLTDAEARVCDLLYQSKNLTEAAKVLGISINTAKTHLNRSFRKVGVQSQAELVRRLNSQLYLS